MAESITKNFQDYVRTSGGSLRCFSEQKPSWVWQKKERPAKPSIIPWTVRLIWHCANSSREDHINRKPDHVPFVPRAHVYISKSSIKSPKDTHTTFICCLIPWLESMCLIKSFFLQFSFHLMFYALALDKVKGDQVCGDLEKDFIVLNSRYLPVGAFYHRLQLCFFQDWFAIE